MESSATVSLCLVGTVIEDGVTYRWLETKVVIHDPPKIAGTQVHKILLPEEDLLESEKPFERVRRAWAQRGDSAAKETQITSGVRSEEFLLWTPGMLKGSEPAKNETKDIDYQQGRFKDSQGRTGEIVHKRRLPNNKEIKRVTKYTVWQHPDLQFGFAEARIVGESFLDAAKIQQFTSVYRLQDVGTDANTELPNNN
jgi:hypothetical protein